VESRGYFVLLWIFREGGGFSLKPAPDVFFLLQGLDIGKTLQLSLRKGRGIILILLFVMKLNRYKKEREEKEREGLKMDSIKINLDEKIEIKIEDDLFNDFFTKKCLEAKDAVISAYEIYMAFVDLYTENIGSKYPSGTWLGKQLIKKYTKKKVNGRIVWLGIGLL